MSNVTTYDVKLRYSVDGRAARDGHQGVIKDAKELKATTDSVTSSMVRMGLAVVGAFGARAAGKALIGFNGTVEDTKNSIAGMLALSKKTDLSAELGNADRLFANLQKRAATLPGTTMEYATMAGMLTQPITDAGLGMKDLEDLTVNTVVAAKALRVESGAAARDVDQALRGQYHSTDVFTGKLLGSVGYKGEEGRAKFNNLDGDKRAQELKRAVMQKQIGQLANAQGQTFSGVLSTLQDTIEQTLGKIGLPLFKAITAEIKDWNAYLDKNSGIVDVWAHKIGEGLVDAFGVVKSAVSFLVDHADLLITIGKTWAMVKIGSAIGSGLGLGGGAIGGMLGSAGGFFKRGTAASYGYDMATGARVEREATGPGKGFQAWNAGGAAGVAGNLPMLGQVAAAGYALGTFINEQTGLSHQVAEGLEFLHPRLDATTTRFNQLELSSKNLDASFADAAKKSKGGFGKDFGGSASTVQTGIIESFKADVAASDAFLAAVNKHGVGSDEAKEAYAAFQARGVSAADVKSERADIPRQLAMQDANRSRAEDNYLREFVTLNATEMKALDVAESQRQVLELIKQGGVLGGMNIKGSGGMFGSLVGEGLDRAAIYDIMHGSGKHGQAEKAKVNVTIQRIEVQSDDPDRFAFGMVEAFRDAAKNPSSALAALREG